ncbi:MAG: ferrous iron transport protein A [Oscillospiraceae bacterium]|nr:ferrous iron transport protein A [Oscillospiraceae bacterium]MCR5807451.1 ferrous iron transport protein A [Oscillospiraceae bacterium]
MIPLNLAENGSENKIVKVSGTPEMRQHLQDMGFTVGETVTLVNVLGGNVIVNVKGTRVAIGADMAKKIMV